MSAVINHHQNVARGGKHQQDKSTIRREERLFPKILKEPPVASNES
jgi:hypothetical protein